MQTGFALFLMGVSGSGKTSVMRKLLEVFPQLHYVQSFTTRDLRPGEHDGEKYRHITTDSFQQGIDAADFLEYALVHKQDLYGTKFADIRNVLDTGGIPIKEIEIAGYKQILVHPEMNDLTKSVFLTTSDDIMRERILLRDPHTPTHDIEKRIASAQAERDYAQEYCDIVIDAGKPLPAMEEDVIQALYSLGL